MGQAFGTNVWSDGVIFRDSICELTGRLGVATIGGRNILVERNTFDKIATALFGMEPNDSTGGADNVVYRDNIIGTYGLNNLFESYFYYASGAEGAPVTNVKISGNTVEGGIDGTKLGIQLVLIFW